MKRTLGACKSILLAAITTVFAPVALGHNICNEKIGNLNGPQISRYSWQVQVKPSDVVDTFYISFCQPLQFPPGSLAEQCNGASVCRVRDKVVTVHSNLNYNVSMMLPTTPWLVVSGLQCTASEQYRLTIRHSCGLHLGSPEFLAESKSRCQTFFSWRTSAACASSGRRNETPCYAYNADGAKFDLTPLMKMTGSHPVESLDKDVDLRINVCSDMVGEEGEEYPSMSGACLMQKDGKCTSVGQLHSGPSFETGAPHLEIAYSTNSTHEGCSLPARTVIAFKCPGRGKSHPPRLISSWHCQFHVEWETQFACPLDQITGNPDTCKFTEETHGFDIDLSPLKMLEGQYHNTTLNVEGAAVTVIYNICNQGTGSSESCGRGKRYNTAICLINDTMSISLGDVRDSKLQLVDGIASVLFQEGSPCPNNRTWSSVIDFVCNKKQAMGHLELEFVDDDNCQYHFVWETEHACLEKSSPSCVMQEGDIRIDFSSLATGKGQDPWIALGSPEKDLNGTFYVRLCSRSGDGDWILRGCGADSAICFVGGEGKVVSYGQFFSKPTYDKQTKTVTVTTSGWQQCRPGRNYSSSIYLVCKPGATTESPVFLGMDDTGCLAEFEWHTASACPLKSVVGSGCRIEDDELGFTLDLSPLTSSVPYKIENAQYTYYLNVCGDLRDTPCSTATTASPTVCQESQDKKRTWVLGAGEPLLSYVDGMVNLTYTNGTPYNDVNRTPRKSSIAFLCDHDAGIGYPSFVEEADRTYSFVWYTSYACPSSYYTPCVYKDNASGLHYDLSRLSQLHDNEDWVVESADRDGSLRYHISVCRPLRKPPQGCSSTAAACVLREYSNGTEVVEVKDAGKARNPLTFRDGALTLFYDLGQECTQYGVKVNYSVSIHFLCDPKQVESLTFMKKVGNCNYLFVWSTHAACPVSHQGVRDSCTLRDNRTGILYDLSPLRLPNSYYTVSNGTEVYELNICGPVHGGHCQSTPNVSVCKVDSKKGYPVGFFDNMFLSSDSEGSMKLAYVGDFKSHSGDATKVLIEVTCNPTVEGARFALLKAGDDSFGAHVLSLETELACPPVDSDAGCSFFDDKAQERYDLSPLAGRVHHASDPSGRRHFLLGFCGPIVTPGHQDVQCPAGSAACELGTPLSHAAKLGSVMSAPHVASDGSIVVRYPYGEQCGNGTMKNSALITLLCDDTEEAPMFMGESPACNYLFTYRTPAACPLKLSMGQGCKVTDPRYGYNYDFSQLANSKTDYPVHAGEYTYLINICRPLVAGKGTCEGAASCQTKPSVEDFNVNTGQSSSAVTYRNGQISLYYGDGKGPCHGLYNRSTMIQFVCDHLTDGRATGPTFVAEDSNCTYLFEWRTSFACPKIAESECSVNLNDTHMVDLSPLSNPKENYEIRTSSGTRVVLNVCRSVIYKPESACPSTAGACAILHPDSIKSLGRVGSRPYLEMGNIKLRYSLGDRCDQGSSPRGTAKWETIIEFECDPTAQVGIPELLGLQDKCVYNVKWRTVYACPMAQDSIHDQCSALHPLTGEAIDLSSLKRTTPYTYRSSSSEVYKLSICGPLSESACGTDVGVCLEDRRPGAQHNLGLANNQLHFRDGVMFLNYSGGDACPVAVGGRRSSLIQFVCSSAGYSHLGPQLIHVQNDCTYYFVWHTELACQNVLHCAVKEGGLQFDLSPLILSSGRYTALNVDHPGYVYYINVCRPLSPVHPYHHLPSAGIIRVSEDGKTVESLGSVPMEPFNDFQGHVSLLYVNGSRCASNENTSNKARIIFICDPSSSVEQPSLVDIDADECIFLFEWRTSLVCPHRADVPDGTDKDCSLAVHQHGLRFDLAQLQNKRNGSPSSLFEVSVPSEEGKFVIDVCGHLNMSGCTESSICFLSANHQEGYGIQTSTTYYDGSLKVRYSNGSACTSSEAPFRSAEINFECNHGVGVGAPILVHKYACHSTFKWPTSLVCLEEPKECTVVSDNDVYDFGLLSSISTLWNVTDEQGNMYWMNVCHGMKADKSGVQSCSSSAAACMRSALHDGHEYTIGKLVSQRITVPKPGEVLFTYGGGDPSVCLKKGQFPETRITFTCPVGGGTVGVPEMIHGPSEQECTFAFRWESRMACPQKEGVVLPEENGMIVDQRSNFVMNFSAILDGTFKVAEKRGEDEYLYIIQLRESLSSTAETCFQAGVCQTKPSTGFHRDVGSYITRRFVLRGSELLLEMKSVTSRCGRTSKEVTSIISFFCSPQAGLGEPEFLYESSKCHYLFSWQTSLVCISAQRPIASHDEQILPAQGAQTSGTSHILIAVSICGCVLLAIGIFIVLRKEQRRDKIKSMIGRVLRRAPIPPYHYSKTASSVHAVQEDGDTVLLSSAAFVPSVDEPGDVDPIG
ncbi:cation-independent mannose-6-phosphate receptor-like [Ornithodoros turicata]|uniref:cation-independent mannose-6-phosphate receptor-like n=1 Tax=Ornithodoros turicata TaxID=34597 RepID=UPI003138AF34